MAEFNWPSSNSSGVPIYATLSAFPSGSAAGDLAVAADTQILYVWDGGAWVVEAGPGVALSIGAFGSSPNANGLTLSGNSLNLQPADATHPGGLLAADWVTFNAKQPAGNYITALTGDVTASGPGSVAATVAKIQSTTVSGTTGSTNVVFSSAPTLTNPIVGTQSQGDSSTKAASTAYVDTAIANAVAGINPAVAVQAATTQASDTSGLTYNNGASGVGATFTGPVNTALTIDGYTFTALGQRLLVKNDTQSPSGAFNGIYYVTQVQTAILGIILTRALDYNTPSDINNTGAIPVINGTSNGTTQWVLTSSVATVGTSPLTFTEFTRNPADYLLKANNLSDVSTAATAFNNISGLTTLGDLIYGGASGVRSRLAGNTATSTTLLSSVGSGGLATAPAWLTATNASTASTVVLRDSSSNFSAGTITAALSGNATTATTATNATNVATTATNSTNASFFPTFVSSSSSGNQGVDTATGLTFNPSTNSLTTTTFVGALTGTASGNLTLASPTNHGVLFSGSANATTASAAGTAGQMLQSGGSSADPTWIAKPVYNKQVFGTVSTSNFTIPSGTLSTTVFKFTITGGGGGGGGAATGNPAVGGGGGAGGTAIAWLSGLTAGNTISVTVGQGGAAGNTSGGNGTSGDASQIASGTQTITTVTGGGGLFGAGTTGTSGAAGGAGSAGTNGDINNTGGSGGDGYATGAGFCYSGYGGASFWGGGGRAQEIGSTGDDGKAYGSGGGGGATNAGNRAGGTGKQGIVLVEWVL